MRKQLIEAYRIYMRSYKEAYEKRDIRINIYEKYGYPQCPIIGVINDCRKCSNQCIDSDFRCLLNCIPAKNQVKGRLKEVAPVYHRLVVMEALKQKAHLFGRK